MLCLIVVPVFTLYQLRATIELHSTYHYSVGRSANELNAPFSFKSSASKSERGSALAERGTLGHFFFAVAGSKKETFKEVAQKVAPVSEKSFGENGTAA